MSRAHRVRDVIVLQDYVDAFERVLRVDAKQRHLQRETLNVVVDVCLQEKQFNPFYAHLANKFCLHERKYQVRSSKQFTQTQIHATCNVSST